MIHDHDQDQDSYRIATDEERRSSLTLLWQYRDEQQREQQSLLDFICDDRLLVEMAELEMLLKQD